MTTPTPLRPPMADPALPPQLAPVGAMGSTLGAGGNPIVNEIDQAHSLLSPQAKQAIEGAHGMLGLSPQATQQHVENAALAAAPSLAPAAPSGPSSAPAMLPNSEALDVPQAEAPSLHPKSDEYQRILSSGSGISQIHNPLLKGLATVGDALGQFFPRISAVIPGTTAHHQLVAGEAQRGAAEETGQERLADEMKNTETKRGLEEAQTANQEAIPELKKTAGELAASKASEISTHNRATEAAATAKTESTAQIAAEKRRGTLAQHGFEENEKGEIVPLPYEKMSETQQAVHDLKAAQSEQAEATAALRKAQAANQPAMAALAQKRLQSAQEAHAIATRRLGLSEKQFEMRAHGTEGGTPLPGAMQTDTGETVGTANAANVRPTSAQTNKSDLARSAIERVSEMRDILKRNPGLTGPGNGRKSQLEIAIGNEDPDALKFVAASKYLADHSAALFGGRSKYISEGLESLSSLHHNPAALSAALDEAEKTARPFAESGTRHTVGGTHEIKPGGGPAVGTVEGGYRFKGGDAKDQKNWEKQ